ncbi:hypothetical protein GEMRC1_013548 [Eukaryota sp. GEM-RC1]
MGRKGTVYFHEGSYSFNQGLGKASDVEWEVIGLGDVMVEGTGAALLEIDDSIFTLSNVVVYTSTSIAFNISNSNMSINRCTIFSSYPLFDGIVNNSTLNVSSSIFSSFSFEVSRSEVVFSDSSFNGEVADFIMSMSYSVVTVTTSTFDQVIGNTLLYSDRCTLIVKQSFFTEIFASSMINLNNSELNIYHCDFSKSSGEVFVESNESIVIVKYLDFKLSNFAQWFGILSGSFIGQDIVFLETDQDVFHFENCTEVFLQNVTVSQSNLGLLIQSINSFITISRVSILNSTGTSVVAGYDSVINLDSCDVLNCSFDSFVGLDFSNLTASIVESTFSNYSNSLLFFSNSTVFMEDILMNNVSAITFLNTFDSLAIFYNTVITNFKFWCYLDLLQSNVSFISLTKTDCMSHFIDFSIADVIMIDSELTLQNSNISGCISNNLFKNSFNLDRSRLFLVNFEGPLFLSSLSLVKSFCKFNSNFPIISKSLTFDEESSITSTPSIIDLSQLSSNLLISPSKHCCNTSFCQVSLQVDDVTMLENLLIVSARQSAGFYYSYQLNHLNIVLEHSTSFNYFSPSILFSFVIDQILFSYQLFIPICPIEFVSLEPPTRGGFVPLFAFNLGLDPIFIHHSSAMINQTVVYSSKMMTF